MSDKSSHSLKVSHSLTLVILNNFCFHVYAQKSLSYSHTLSFSPFIIICLPKILDTRTEERMRNMVIHHENKVYDKALEDASWGLNAAGMLLYNEAIIMAGVPDLHTTLKVDVDFSKKVFFRVLRATKKRRFFKLKKVYLSVWGLQKSKFFSISPFMPDG